MLKIWDIENTSIMAHPFHIHGNSFQVVSRTNGVRPIHDYELGWKDVIVVHSEETVRIIKSFEDYADPEGPYMSHCHILEHEDAGMMTHWVVVDQSTPVSPEEVPFYLAREVVLNPNYPNPFNPLTTIVYSLSEPSEVSLIIYNLLGQEVERLADGEMPAGTHETVWNASNFASSIYFYRLQAGNIIQIRKMVLLK